MVKVHCCMVVGIVIFALCPVLLLSQAPDTLWTQTFGGTENDFGWKAIVASDGYAMIGRTNSLGAGSYDMWVVKTDSSGNPEWARPYGGQYQENGNDIKQTADGGFIIAGATFSYGSSPGNTRDVYLVKTDDNGIQSWSNVFGGNDHDLGYSVDFVPGGGYVIAGWTDSYGVGNRDMYLVKTDASGNAIWDYAYGGTDDDRAYDGVVANDSGYVMIGYTRSFGMGGDDVYLVKTDKDGNKLWDKTFGGIQDDVARSINRTSDGGYIIAGRTNSMGAGGYDVYLVKADSNGNGQWTERYGGVGHDFGYYACETPDGGFVVAGYTESFGSDKQIYVIKVDSNGDTIWTRRWGAANDDRAFSVEITPEGGYIIGGYTTSFGAGQYDYYLLKTGVDPTNIEEKEQGNHSELFEIGQCPFLSKLNIRFSMSGFGSARVAVFNAAGKRVRTLLDENRAKGIHFVYWDGRDERGLKLPSGVYFINLATEKGSKSKKTLILR